MSVPHAHPARDTAAGGREANRRATVRYQCAPATAGRLYSGDAHEFQLAWVQDLSVAGVGLVVSRPLPAGTQVHIQLRADAHVFQLLGRVVHATEQPSGDWLIGCELVNRLTNEDLDFLL